MTDRSCNAHFYIYVALLRRADSVTETTRHRASTSMYSLTFRVRVATPAQYG